MSFGELASSWPQGISSSFADTTARPEPTTLRLSDPHATSLQQCLCARLRLAQKCAGLSQTTMGQLFGVSFQQYRKYETVENRISAVALHWPVTCLHVSTEWFHAEGGQEAGTQCPHSEPMGPEAAMLLARFDAIRGEDDRALLLKLAARLAGWAPVEAATTGQGTATPAASNEITRGREVRRVLLVDDDRNALVVASAFLRKAGFEAVTAASGNEALQLLTTVGAVDALITDHAMPGLSGLDLVGSALELRPDLPALVITGYSSDAELGRLPEHVQVLSKPFTRDEFVRCVQELLVGAADINPRLTI